MSQQDVRSLPGQLASLLPADSQIEDAQTQNRIMLFEMAIDGHHSIYIQHLVRYWCEQGLSGNFYIVVTAEFVSECAEVMAIAQQYPQSNISFLPLTPAEAATLTSSPSSFFQRKARAWQEWALLCAYAKKLRATHCLLASFDFFIWPFVLAQKPPCPISSIYFKPTFHYASFPGYIPTIKSRLQQQEERLLLSLAFRQSYLHRLFCLDSLAVEALNKGRTKNKAVALADPVEIPIAQTPLTELRSQLNIATDRKVFLLFGELTERKGIAQMLEAIALLPAELCEKVCFLLVGRCSLAAKQRFQTKIVQVQRTQPVQIIEQYEFISQQAVQNYFQLADVVLAPYQKHVGMSGILLQAAAAQTPVLSSDYGLMGELVRRYQLGLAVDSTRPVELRKALSQFLQDPTDTFYSPVKMKQFAEQNTVEKFASTILNAVRSSQ